MNDTAVIYYSRTGVTSLAAKSLGELLDCPIFEDDVEILLRVVSDENGNRISLHGDRHENR